jgi:hypothetical protein
MNENSINPIASASIHSPVVSVDLGEPSNIILSTVATGSSFQTLQAFQHRIGLGGAFY